MIQYTHVLAATPSGVPEAVNATARIPIASGSLYHGVGWKRDGERRVSDMEIAKVWNWCGNQEERRGEM